MTFGHPGQERQAGELRRKEGKKGHSPKAEEKCVFASLLRRGSGGRERERRKEHGGKQNKVSQGVFWTPPPRPPRALTSSSRVISPAHHHGFLHLLISSLSSGMSDFLGLFDSLPGVSCDRFDGANLQSDQFFLSHCHAGKDRMETSILGRQFLLFPIHPLSSFSCLPQIT